MGKKPKIRITVIGKKESGPCHYGHQKGDTFDFDTERGKLCPMLAHVAFPYIDILRYGGSIPGEASANECTICCPDVKTIQMIRIEKIEP